MLLLVLILVCFTTSTAKAADYTLKTLPTSLSASRSERPNLFSNSYRTLSKTMPDLLSSSHAGGQDLDHQMQARDNTLSMDLKIIFYCDEDEFRGQCWAFAPNTRVCKKITKTINSFRAPVSHYCTLFKSDNCNESNPQERSFVPEGLASAVLKLGKGYPHGSYVCNNEGLPLPPH